MRQLEKRHWRQHHKQRFFFVAAINEMLKRAKSDKNYYDLILNPSDNWYSEQSWTVEEDKEFVAWLTSEALRKKIVHFEYFARLQAEWFTANYGPSITYGNNR